MGRQLDRWLARHDAKNQATTEHIHQVSPQTWLELDARNTDYWRGVPPGTTLAEMEEHVRFAEEQRRDRQP